jgi:hypothetical protein
MVVGSTNDLKPASLILLSRMRWIVPNAREFGVV